MTGFVKGWKRRFWQGSTDHRGVPGAPGRVVTLLPGESDITWGVCYEVAAEEVDNVLSYLDYREKGGYTRAEVDVFTHVGHEQPRLTRVLLYTATEENPNYLGPAPEDEIAQQIFVSEGPSGKNIEYLLELARSLKEMGIHDPHVHDLEERVHRLLLSHRGSSQ